MLFQITAAGRALLEADPTGVVVTRSDFGSAFNYVPANEPVGLQGSIVYTTNAVFSPSIANLNTLRYSVFIPGPAGPFTFGEVALYVGSTLFGVGAQVIPIVKTVGDVDNQYRLDVFVDTAPGSRFASFEVVSSATRNFYPRVSSVDSLVPPHLDGNNAYVVYGTPQVGQGFLAYSDPTGAWTFSSKPHVWFQGAIDSIGPQGLQSDDLLNAEYVGTLTDLVIQFITGAQRGYCRKVTGLTTAGAVLWNTDMLVLPEVGDQFIIQGPDATVGFAGTHNSLAGIQGGTTTERYHLTANEHANAQYPRVKIREVITPTDVLLATDDDTYIDINADCVFSVPALTQTTYPIGGLSVLRINGPAEVTIQGSGGNVIEPDNVTTVTVQAGKVINFALVRKSATEWDLVAPQDGTGGVGGGNVSHSFVTSRAEDNFLPHYSPNGNVLGPVAEIELSRVQVTDGIRIYPGDQAVASAWTAPAVLVWPLAFGTGGSTATGLPNTSATSSLTLDINGTDYTLLVMGSAAQTFASLITALNNSATTVVGAAASVIFSLVRGKIVLTVSSTTVPTTLAVVAPYTLLTQVANGDLLMGQSTSSQVNAVGSNSIVLDMFETDSKQIRPVDANSIAIGLRSRVKGELSVVLGGDFTSIDGDRSAAVGADGGRIDADNSQILGGSGTLIGLAGGATGDRPENVVAVGGIDNRLEADGTNALDDSVLIGGKNTKITRSTSVAIGSADSDITAENSVLISSKQSNVSGERSIAIASEDASASGKRAVMLAATDITGATGEGVVVIGGSNLNVTATKDLVVFGNKNKTIPQQSALVYPTSAELGTSFTLTLAANGSGADLRLTTDGLAASALNGMKVDSCWCIRGNVSISSATQHKAWSIDAMMYPSGTSAGSIAPMGQRMEVLGATADTTNWSLDLVTLTADTSIMHLTLNTAAPVTGFDTVHASAVIHVTRALPF
jgi:hypothetical protein